MDAHKIEFKVIPCEEMIFLKTQLKKVFCLHSNFTITTYENYIRSRHCKIPKKNNDALSNQGRYKISFHSISHLYLILMW